MEYTEKYCEQDFIDFKEQLVFLAEEQFHACNHFTNKVLEADSPSRLREVFIHMADEIFDKLGGEHDTDDLERHIGSLQDEVCELEDKIREHEELFPTYYDEMKLQTFIELHSKYTPWEFEQLLLNGKL